MPQPKRGLGKGLGALIPTAPAGANSLSADTTMAAVTGAYLEEIPVASIQPNPRQPREVFDEDSLAELAASIEAVGLLQPVVVRLSGSGRYELIMGERRWRASQRAGLEVIPAIVRQTS